MQEDADREVFFSNLPVEFRDRQLALVVVILSALVFGAVAPFARVQLPEIPAFVASYQSALAVSDVITAVLLFAQFSVLRSRALLLLAGGYLFTAAMATVHTLSFPGLFAPAGLFQAVNPRQTTFWLYLLWHGGFPILVLGYALLRRKDADSETRRSVGGAILLSVIAVGVVVLACTLLTTIGHALLPIFVREGRSTPAMIGALSAVCALCIAALAGLWLRRPRSALDVWLMVVICAWFFEFTLSSVVNGDRFDLGFYVGRMYGLLAASFVLIMLMIKSTAQQLQLSRLLETVRQQRAAERDSFKRARAPVQRRRRIVQRCHHHQDPRRHHHRLEPGGGEPVRVQRRRGHRQEHRYHRARGAARRGAQDSRSGTQRRRHQELRDRAGFARTAGRSTFR